MISSEERSETFSLLVFRLSSFDYSKDTFVNFWIFFVKRVGLGIKNCCILMIFLSPVVVPSNDRHLPDYSTCRWWR